MTDIPAALRREIEALENAAERACEHAFVSHKELEKLDAARAALCAKVEALMLRYGDLLGEAPMHFSPESLICALLNEEPKDGDD